jgi:hypothetical protein
VCAAADALTQTFLGAQVYVRRDPDEDLSSVVADLARIAAALHPQRHPHALPYQVQ